MDIIYLHNDKIMGIIWISSGPHVAVCHWHDGSDWGNLQVAFFQIVFFLYPPCRLPSGNLT